MQTASITKRNEPFYDKVKGSIYGYIIGNQIGSSTELLLEDKASKVASLLEYPDMFTYDVDILLEIMSVISMMIDNEDFCLSKTYYNYNLYREEVRSIVSKYFGNKRFLDDSPLVRALPISFLSSEYKYYNTSQSRIHEHNRGNSSVVLEYTRMIWSLTNGIYCTPIKSNTEKILEPLAYMKNTWNNSLHFSNCYDYSESMLMIAKRGGNSSRIASITGSIIGAQQGVSCIPKYMLNKLPDYVNISVNLFVKKIKKVFTNTIV